MAGASQEHKMGPKCRQLRQSRSSSMIKKTEAFDGNAGKGANQRRQLIPSKQIQKKQAGIHNLRIRQKGKTAGTESLLGNRV